MGRRRHEERERGKGMWLVGGGYNGVEVAWPRLLTAAASAENRFIYRRNDDRPRPHLPTSSFYSRGECGDRPTHV